MKVKFLTCTVLMILISGCDKQPEQPKSADAAVVQQHTDPAVHQQTEQMTPAIQSPTSINYSVQFEQSDEKISHFMDKLDNPQTSQDERMKILCEDWPKVYQTEYMPALLHLKPKEFTQEKLLAELKSATDFYKQGAGIQCK